MRLSWFGDFFGALPDALEALWLFGDPAGRGQGWWGIVIAIVWGVLLIALPLAVAKLTYGRREWVSATMGVIGGLAIFWWVFGILPSAWIYYLDANKEILAGPIIPATAGITFESGFLWWPAGYRLDLASSLYTVIRDVVVVVQHLVAFVLVFWAAKRIQERLPKTLAAGETRPESGGYK